MKKTYVIPAMQVVTFAQEKPVAYSNQVDGNGFTLNPTTMDEGDGSDAVKHNDYNVWNDDWSR